ncbi:RNB domain-containing ribonuclease [Leucobacter luti]|uniref:Exoribonuclease R n=1 Tax=Leucobacter luti TaxID=340320 RepID=A0A4Q7U4P3_9MICO|nr:RNB domain-containing ribonuclease [Leucobacter luti]MBL3700540.1 RNB domain-containing ribonuclease [Leucobacter luti]RZT68625.1 exoribonuclease R [Leucobacter luti]
MPARRAHLAPQSSHGELAEALAALRTEFSVPEAFPAAALSEAAETAAPEVEFDLRDVPFVTLDPPGSRDLDQAFSIERAGSGWVVRYAIADVAAFVRPESALDLAARDRGQTLYLPDGTVPLHPRVLSEGRASLLPGADRTAYVWTVRLDDAGAVTGCDVRRARVRSRAQLDYPSAQRDIDRGTAAAPLALLPEVGRARAEQERLRGGASLNMPEEQITETPSGYHIERRFPLPVEEWNAQLSLLVGIAAGEMMLAAGVGVLRTMPAPSTEALGAFRTRVAALGEPWPAGLSYGDYLRSLDPASVRTPAVMQAAAALFRGADYAAFDGTPPAETRQAAIAAPYAHVTAPLRRLVDRWGLILCAAICADTAVPEWARASLPQLPELMRASNQRAAQIGSAALDRVEAALVAERIGERFTAVVIEVRGERARVQLVEPPVTAQCPAAGAAAGTTIEVRVVGADIRTGTIQLELA